MRKSFERAISSVSNPLIISAIAATAGLLWTDALRAGTTVLSLDFSSASQLPTSGGGALAPGQGLNGGTGFEFNSDNDYEVFWNIRPGGTPFTKNDGLGIYHLSYYHFLPIGTPPFAQTSVITTYSDAFKSVGSNGQDRYAPLAVMKHSPTNVTKQTVSAWAQLFINQRNVAVNIDSGVWLRIDHYIKLFDPTPVSSYFDSLGNYNVVAQGLARVQNQAQTVTLGAQLLDPAFHSNYTGVLGYTQREARAIQLFGFGETHFFDDIKVETVDSTDFDLVLRDVRNNVTSRRSDYNGDGLLTGIDSRYFINNISDVAFGDANVDRVVNVADVSIWRANVTNAAAKWATADFTGDDRATLADLKLIVANFSQSSGSFTNAAGGSFNTATNWGDGAVPNAPGATAVLTRNEGGVVTVDSDVRVGLLGFGGTSGYTLQGPAKITLDSGSATIPAYVIVSTGTHTGSAAIELASPTNVDVAPGAKLTTGPIITAASAPANTPLTVSGGGTLAIAGVYDAGPIAITENSVVKLGPGAVLAGTTLGAVRAQIKTGLDTAGVTGLSAIGVGDGRDAFARLATVDNTAGTAAYFSTFLGRPAFSTDILVRYTYAGDADLSGTIDGSDIAAFLEGYSLGLTGWGNGDFDYDGAVTPADYALLANSLAYVAGGGASFGSPLESPGSGGPGSGAIPEPSVGLALVCPAVFGLFRSRRKPASHQAS